MTTRQLAYAEAYAVQGGGFRGVAKNHLTGAVERGPITATIGEARNDAKRLVFAWADGRNMLTGTYRGTPRLWRCNYFIRADEVVPAELCAA